MAWAARASAWWAAVSVDNEALTRENRRSARASRHDIVVSLCVAWSGAGRRSVPLIARILHHEGVDGHERAAGPCALAVRLASGRPVAGAAPLLLPHDAAVAAARRQGDPAQEPEPELLPDQRCGTRGYSGRGRDGAPARPRLGVSVLSRPRARSGPRRDGDRHAPERGGRPRRSAFRRPPDAHPLELRPSPHRLPVERLHHTVPPCRGGRRGRRPAPAQCGARPGRAGPGGRGRARHPR